MLREHSVKTSEGIKTNAYLDLPLERYSQTETTAAFPDIPKIIAQ